MNELAPLLTGEIVRVDAEVLARYAPREIEIMKNHGAPIGADASFEAGEVGRMKVQDGIRNPGASSCGRTQDSSGRFRWGIAR